MQTESPKDTKVDGEQMTGPLIKTYKIIIVREAGPDPVTGEVLGYAEEHITVDATSRQAAYELAQMLDTLKFRGQVRRTIIDGEEHFDERY
ncbi:hypothetical protein GCM10023189_07030 [Nibrella saemangeumensis]|uniref:Uncharacterized protein n=1 Tax=Nibrella saemangeumensis TaxID=1084526 RepID=A0ABP8MFR6_9BACT